MSLVKTSAAFIPTMDTRKKSNLSLSCLAHVGSASGQSWVLDASAWPAANRQVSTQGPQMQQEEVTPACNFDWGTSKIQFLLGSTELSHVVGKISI